MTLTILICTIPQRKAMFDTLLAELLKQADGLGEHVEIIADGNNGSIGAKRQGLLEMAKGEYIVFIDDDDSVAPDYIRSILDALLTKPDCIGFNGKMTTDGRNEQKWIISNRYKRWHEDRNTYYRCTNHITPVRRDIALSVGFKNKSHGEDYDYSMGLVGKCIVETFIDKYLYHYNYKTVNKNG